MNLLLVIDSLGSGGAQRQMVTLALGLHQAGHHIEVFVYYFEEHFLSLLETAGIEVHLYPKRHRYSMGPVLALKRLVRRRSFDVVLAFLDTPSLYAELAFVFNSRLKLVVSERFMYLPGRLSLPKRIQQKMHQIADAITVNSHHQRHRMVDKFPWMSTKITTIYNGYDLHEFRSNGASNAEHGGLRLLAIASVSAKKNSENLAKALAICINYHGIRVSVVWIGKQEVSGEGRGPFERTSAILHQENIEPHWQWLGERKDIAEQLADCDALIHPSFYEGLSNAICEALCCGRPVLAGRVCDHEFLIQHGVRGLLFDPSSPESIAMCISSFAALDPDRRVSMGEEGRRFAELYLSRARYVQNYAELFQRLLSKDRKRA